jgi:glycine/D-amino acid oxidase-like deaminating enzyme
VIERDYRSYSFWLDSCVDDLSPRPALSENVDVDIAILGAGFTGLWTAYYLTEKDPSLKIAVLEKDIAGFGASGRNGGWCSSNFVVSSDDLADRFGAGAARETQLAMNATVDEIEGVITKEGIQADFRKGGELQVALGPHHMNALNATMKGFERIGLPDQAYMLDADRVARRLRIAGAVAGIYYPQCAVVHPGKLVRGLARAVERRGVTIYEATAVKGYNSGRIRALITDHGVVRAHTMVLAGEAYLTRLKPLHRQLLPIYSLIVLTEPLSEAQWAEIGWQGHECVNSARYTVDYLSRTSDGRILFGGRGAPYHFGSRIDDAFDSHEATHALLQRLVTEWFPMLRGVRFTHKWGGPLGVARDWLTTATFDRNTGVASARGYTGQGVSTTNLTGRILADLITESDSPITSLPFVRHESPNWEIEPLRWLGASYVMRGLDRIDRRSERTGRPPTGRSLAERLVSH